MPGYEVLDAKPIYGGIITNIEESEKWPVDDNTYDEVLAIHVLEHIAPKKVDFFFKEVLRVLKPGCRFRVHVPSGEVIAKAFVEIPARRAGMQICLYGVADEFDQHKFLYCYTLLAEVFSRNGFTDILEVTENRDFRDRHDEGWEPLFGKFGLMSLKVVGSKPQ